MMAQLIDRKHLKQEMKELLVALFYLPVYQCTELGYFDTAKHTSGVGEGAAPKDPGSFDSGWGGF